MFDSYPIVQIQGIYYKVDELKLLCKEKISNSQVQNWEKEIYLFLLELFSSSLTINVSTSGSSGFPKKIVLQKEHLIASAKATIKFFDLKKDDTIWLCLPVAYIAGKMMIVRSIVGGLNLLYCKPSSIPLYDKNTNVDFVAMVPNQIFEMLETEVGLRQLSKIKKLLIGGSELSNELEESLLERSSVNAWHSYGMTETITHIALCKLSSANKKGVFKLLPEISVRLNKNEQLIINAPSVGVFNLVTNDIAKINEDGSFLIIGRSDNVIISGGVSLFPEIIEQKIEKHIPSNFFIGGLPDEKLG
ncbi:MAG TPA: AMP-binding protein, partial [Bacteroidales bacterium]|nr:AMP-binding protein [Bacteroidales bacterium]